jgi:hypothetical protein
MFNSRIAFCLNMHNEAVKALMFPPNSHKENRSLRRGARVSSRRVLNYYVPTKLLGKLVGA